MSEASPFLGPMTSTQIDSGVVIPDTEGEFGVSCRHCSEFVVANSFDPRCSKCGYKL
jgi:Zn finger protein HypA/HybF involved in hydrogenase expression